ncbi:type II secretion system protein GspD [Geothermobacter hydrogeniphilus]|uniref:Type II secretion system protein GspD n=2 Tax=Geothermobacter hydrogeniphilus TaxID=1969733 RepID=A0A2K2H9D5_9BACT|nr:type II secretion system protein GspD [Geothermobacter hydrogeniphilus]
MKTMIMMNASRYHRWRAQVVFPTLLILLSLLLSTAPLWAAPTKAPRDDRISLDFKDVELTDLIQTMSELTGRNFLYDEKVRGKVTIVSPGGMKLGDAYQLFLSVLQVKGYTVVPSGKVNKIVPIKSARQENLPVTSRRSDEAYVTRLVTLTYANASDLASTILTPLIPKTSNIVAFAPSNTLVITDSATNIERLVKIIKQLDVPGNLGQMEIFTLKNGDAEEVAKIANSIIGQAGGATGRRARAARNVKTAGSAVASRVIAYPRTNALIAIADAEEMETLRGLIAQLDGESGDERAHINVYYLENADAETLAKTLNEIITGMRTQARTQPTAKGGKGSNPIARGPVSITADKPTNALLINASPEAYTTIKGIIKQLDIKRKQVYVEALILELSMDATREVGASLQGALQIGNNSVVLGTSNLNSGTANFGSLSPASGSQVPSLLTQTINGLLLGGLFSPITATGPDGNEITIPAFSALIRLSETSTDVNILSAPRLLTSDNEEAEIIVGSNVPIITSRLTDTGGTGLAQSVAVERQDVALTLRFTPQVTEGNLVRLNVFQEITDIAPANPAIGDPTEVGPTFTKRQLRNTVLAEDGKTIVLGGLIGTNIQATESKVPLLGDIPFLGRLFRSEGTSEQKTNLLVFITPKIIRNSKDLTDITLKARMTGEGFQTEALRKSVPRDALITNIRGSDDADEETPRP